MMFALRPLGQLVTTISLAALTAGCMGGIFNSYENMSFDGLIDSVPTPELASAADIRAYRAKASPEQPATLNESFKSWCLARGGIWSNSSKVMRDLSFINSHAPSSTPAVPMATMACTSKDRLTFHGAYVTFSNKTVGFYTDVQLSALDAEVAQVSEINKRKEGAERLRKEACLAEKTQQLRTQTRVGMKTLGGTVVEVKQNMALLETPSSTGESIQYWTKLIYLDPPYNDPCNTVAK